MSKVTRLLGAVVACVAGHVAVAQAAKPNILMLFKPIVLREILARGYAPNVKSAKFFIEQRSTEVWDILGEVVNGHPVLLNRAPTLWKLAIQAFYPKLIEGNAIRLHLCVSTGFNAYFDGDQMAVHVPLSQKAVQEARDLMLASRNLLKPADGEPIISPSKDIVLGVYYLTMAQKAQQKGDRSRIF